MKTSQLIAELKDICKRAEIKIIYESKGFPPGYCKVNGQQYLVINRYLSQEEKLPEMVNALKEANLDGVFIKPIIRELLNEKDVLF